jgi:hypothetical protein
LPASGDQHSAITPRFGVQFDPNARTRVKASYAPGGDESTVQSAVNFEEGPVLFKQPATQPVAFLGGRAVMGQSRRLEFGVQRVLDNRSNVEAAAFMDMTSGRGVGLMAMPLSAFSGTPSLAWLRLQTKVVRRAVCVWFYFATIESGLERICRLFLWSRTKTLSPGD